MVRVVVLGGGPAGVTAALQAVELGVRAMPQLWSSLSADLSTE